MLEEAASALASTDVETRRAAVLSLREAVPTGEEGRRERIKLLVTALKDLSWRVRKTAEEILYEEPDPGQYIPLLVELLYIDDNAGARNAAIEMLVKLKKYSVAGLIEAFATGNSDVRKFIIDVLGEFRDKRAVSVMLQALQDEDENVRASAVEHLGALGEPSVVEALIGILESGDLWTSYPAADALGRIGDKRAIPALLAALGRSKSLREPVLKALSALGDETTTAHIVPYIKDGSKVVQEVALKSIEKLYNRGVSEDAVAAALKEHLGGSATEILLEHASGGSAGERASAILLVSLLRDERALGSLLDMSLEEAFAEDVKKALVFIGRARPESLLPLFKNENPYLRRFITSVAGLVASPVYFDVLRGLLTDEDGHVRSLAAESLACLGDLSAIKFIKPLLADQYPDVHEAAVKALAVLKDGLDFQELLSGLESRLAALRKNSAFLLGTVGRREAVPALGFALKDEDPEVRMAAVSALASIKTPESIKYLITALADENPGIRAGAALNLGAAGDPAGFEPLCLLLAETEDSVRAAAARALGKLGHKGAASHLIDLLTDPNGFVVTAAINALRKIGGPSSMGAIIGMLRSPDAEIKRTAIKALAGFEGARQQIVAFLKDPDWGTRMAAVEALGKLSGMEELARHLDTEEDPAVRRAIERLIANVA